MLAAKFGTGDEGSYFLFFKNFPVNEVFDVRVVDVDYHHFSSAACRAAGFDSACSAVADFEEAHESGRFAAAGEVLAAAAQVGEV